MLVPVMVMSYRSGGKMLSMRGRNSAINASISNVPTSAMFAEMRVTVFDESTKLAVTDVASSTSEAADSLPRKYGPMNDRSCRLGNLYRSGSPP